MKTQAFYWQTLYLSTQISITLLFTLCSFTYINQIDNQVLFREKRRSLLFFISEHSDIYSKHCTFFGIANIFMAPGTDVRIPSSPPGLRRRFALILSFWAGMLHSTIALNKHLLKTSSQHFLTITDFAPWSPHVFLDRCPCPVVPRQSQPPCVSVFTSHAKHAINITLCHFIKTSHYFQSWLTSTNASLALRVRLKP